MIDSPALSSLHPAVRGWFERTFGAPSPPQALGWPAIAAGKNVLLLAPTGSGKTLAAFLQCLSRLYCRAEQGIPLDDGVRVLYISPLKALNNDIHRNLELPLDGIAAEAARLGLTLPRLRAAVRTGDTPAAERRAMLRQPPQLLITTPESLFLILSSKAREILRRVEFVIVDEIHALFPNKRGVHLSVSLEHLEALTGRPIKRIGLSATQRPLNEVAAFLGGGTPAADGAWQARPVTILDTGQRKELDLRLLLPVEDLRSLPDKTIWPSVYRQLLQLVREHRSTLIFVNNRRLAERLTANLNDLAGETIAQTHHGSLAKEKRLEVEERLKSGRLPCLVATSSLELGIDVGAIDLVVQVESPKEVARGLQRVGRAGHLVGLPSKGRIIPKTQGDLLECAAILHEMRSGLVEPAHTPENCLDVLAQQLVSLVSVEDRSEEDLFALVRGACPYRNLPRTQFDQVLAMLSGSYESERFLALQPRVFWDRVNGRVSATNRGRRLVYTSGGTIPDRGYFGVYLAGSNARLGELDEEFVAERRLGERFVLGTTAWRIEELRRDRVIVSPAKRGEAMIPFWKGEAAGRPYELGCRLGRFFEELGARLGREDFEAWAEAECLLDGRAARNLHHYLRAQVEATGALPSHCRLIVEEFQDELGEWRVMLHSPFGARVHTPLALLLKQQIRLRDGLDIETMQDDNGILFHCPGAQHPPRLALDDLPLETLPEELATTVRGSTLFALLFRQNAARALILPNGAPGRKRTPLWLARLRAADLLQVVSEYPDFPIVLETLRECLTQSFDLAGLREVLAGLRSGAIVMHRCRSTHPSPFSQALQFNFFGTYMYVPDLPKGEQRFRALGLNREALRELLGAEDLRNLLDPAAIAAVAAEAGGTAEGRRPRNADELHVWLREGRELIPALLSAGAGEDSSDRDRGDLTPGPSPKRRGEQISKEEYLRPFLAELQAANRVALLSWQRGNGPAEAWVAVEDVPTYLASLPGSHIVWPGNRPLPEPADPAEARRRLIRRFTRTHGPFTLGKLAAHYGYTREEGAAELAVLEADGLVQSGEFSPGRSETEWCDVDLLQRIHRRSLARARREIEPRGPAEYAAFLARWHGLGNPDQGPQALAEVLTKLAGLWLPHRAWGGGVLPLRVRDYREEQLERLVATGQFSWVARGTGEEMRLAFEPGLFSQSLNEAKAMTTGVVAIPPERRLGEGSRPPTEGASESGQKVCELLQSRGALFLAQIVQGTGLGPDDALAALEGLTAAGLVTNDTLGPVRFFGARRPEHRRYQLSPQILNGIGRWSLREPGPPPDPETLAGLLLNRYGLVTKDLFQRDFPATDPRLATRDSGLRTDDPRPATRDSGLRPDDSRPATRDYSWDDLLAVFDRWEAVGKVRRGYFVEGLSGLQYALPEAVERLRLPVEEGMPEFWALLRCDPANPYGSLLDMPETGIQPEILVLRRGIPILAAGGKKLRLASIGELPERELAAALGELAKLTAGRSRMVVGEFDGAPILETRAAEILKGLGFERGYRQMVRWRD